MQSCRRCRHGTFDTRIDGLIGSLVALLSGAVEVWRNRQLPHRIKYLRERKPTIPRKGHSESIPHLLALSCTQYHIAASHLQRHINRSLTKFLSVANHALPCATLGGRERQLIVVRSKRLQAENLNARTGRLMKYQACLYHARIIIYKE